MQLVLALAFVVIAAFGLRLVFTQKPSKPKPPPPPLERIEPAESETTVGPTIAPIADRVGLVAGIESFAMDGRRFYFGFNFSNDLVVSPVLASQQEMGEYASKYLEQTDGKHDADYWQKLAEESYEESALVVNSSDREFHRRPIEIYMQSLKQALTKPQPVNHGSIPRHLLYLLQSATEWDQAIIDDPHLNKLSDKIGADLSALAWESLDDAMAMLSGQSELIEQCTYTDVAKFVSCFLTLIIENAPANWSTEFSLLSVD